MLEKNEIKTKDLNREYKRFIGEKKLDYYLTKFERMEEKGTKISFNLCGLIFSFFWCFYRKMFVPGAIFLAYNFLVMYISMRFISSTSTIVSGVFAVLNLIPPLICGFFGNYLYSNYVHSCIAKSLNMPNLQKEKFYKENGDTSTRITLGIVVAYVVFSLALMLSYLPNIQG